MFHVAEKKIELLRWGTWFFISNILILWLAGLEYFTGIPWMGSAVLHPHERILLDIFIVVSYLGHLAFLGFLPSLIIFPLIFIFPRIRLITFLAIWMVTISITMLFIDATIYNLYRYHLNGIMLSLMFHSVRKNVFGLSMIEMSLIISFICVVFFLEWWYGRWLFRRLKQKPLLKGWLPWIMIGLCFCFYMSYSMIFFSTHLRINRVLIQGARFLPLYYEVLSAIIPGKNSFFGITRFGEDSPVQPEKSYAALNYPLHPLQCIPEKKPMNIVLIAIDSWRFDMLNKIITPNMYQFAQNSLVFSNHVSGGNSTGPGIFSLFYSIPANYWTSMEKQNRGPAFIDELLKQHYFIKIISSAELTIPRFDRTVFKAIKNSEMNIQPGVTPNDRDQMVTDKFKKMINELAPLKQPFFTFLFYDSAHSYCATGGNDSPFKPIEEECFRFSLSREKNPLLYFNRYKNGIYFIDRQIRIVLESLQSNGMMDNTVVLITGDHGEEFDDNHLGYWGHAGNFTRYQIQVPLIVHFPHEKPHEYTHRTSHYDIVPTLLNRIAGCLSPVSDYSVGTDLLDKSMRPYLVVNSYIDFGILELDRITTIFPTGYFNIEKLNGQSIPDAKLNMPVVLEAFHEIKQFYRG